MNSPEGTMRLLHELLQSVTYGSYVISAEVCTCICTSSSEEVSRGKSLPSINYFVGQAGAFPFYSILFSTTTAIFSRNAFTEDLTSPFPPCPTLRPTSLFQTPREGAVAGSSWGKWFPRSKANLWAAQSQALTQDFHFGIALIFVGM